MKLKCFIFALFLSLGFFSQQATAQDASPRREVGIQVNAINFNGNNAFSAFFKKEVKENVYRRFRVFYGNFGADFILNSATYNGSAGIAIGTEKRKALDSKLVFYQGPELSASFGITHVNLSSMNTTDFSRYTANARLGWVVGLQHSFNERWAINLETIPGIGFGLSGETNSDPDFQTNIGFNSNVSIGFVRKF